MAAKAPLPDREYIETGNEPEYFITDIRFEPAGGGNIRVFCYQVIHRQHHLLFKTVVPSAALSQMGRQAMQAAADVHNMTQWDDEFSEH